jgi:hypothetical protein
MKRRADILFLIAVVTTGVANGASVTYEFTSAVPGTITDSVGNGVGFTNRLPGTGGALPANDPNLALNTGGSGTLTIMTTTNDINGQIALGVGEYMGIKLSSLGFTGSEDFSVSAAFLDSVFSENYDQFGIIIGAASDVNVRMGPLFAGGPVIYSTNNIGIDVLAYFDGTFAPLQGDDITLNVTRQGGVYSFGITNLTTPALSGQFSMAWPPNFLNIASDLIVGVYAASAVNTNPKPVILDKFEVTVGAVSPPAHPGDFDADGDVDGADFATWQNNFPTPSGAAVLAGDADGDGDVDGADFIVWQTNFPYAPGAGSSPVPEPNAALLLLAGTAMAFGYKSARRGKLIAISI